VFTIDHVTSVSDFILIVNHGNNPVTMAVFSTLSPTASWWYKTAQVPRPPLSETELDQVAELVRKGRFISQIAVDLGWETSKVKRSLNHLRLQVALESGKVWVDTKEKSPVAVALEWIRLRSSVAER
jgi:hypothetical protein